MAPMESQATGGRFLVVALALSAVKGAVGSLPYGGAPAYANSTQQHALTMPQAPSYGATRLHPDKAPLRTSGRYVVDRQGQRVKWSCVSWYGAYSTTHAVGGLEVRRMDEIVDRIVELGFNCVRMMYSTQGYVTNPEIEDDVVAANPELRGMRFLELFDRTIQAVTDKGLMVIVNNHNSKSGWCCHYSQDEGLWYVPEYTEEQWIESLVFLAARYRSNPMVVAFDLRNEVHDYKDTHLTWGSGDTKTDWAAAAVRAGNAVLTVSPDLLIVVMAMCFGMDLRPMRDMPLQIMYPNRIVYQTHNYLEFQVMDNIAKMYAPWHVIRHYALLVSFGLVCLVSALVYGWARIGKPRPPQGLLSTSLGGWFFVGFIAAVIFMHRLYQFGMLFCEVMVQTDLLPFIRWAVGATVVSLLMFLSGVRRMRCLPAKHEDACWGTDAAVDAAAEAAVTHVPTELTVAEKTEYSRRVADADAEKVDVEAASEDAAEAACSGCAGRKVRHFASSSQMRVALFCDAERTLLRVFNWLGFAKMPCKPRGAKLEAEGPAQWDFGMLLVLQLGIVASILTLVTLAIYITAHIVPTYWWLERHLDKMWGFALEEGHEYTAPVWMGEFGGGVRGQWWLNFVRYLATRDVDWAYWAINGKKWAEGYMTSTGQFVNYDEPRWDDEAYGVLKSDYETVRHPWKLLDMQALMASPVTWRPDAKPCSKSVDPACEA